MKEKKEKSRIEVGVKWHLEANCIWVGLSGQEKKNNFVNTGSVIILFCLSLISSKPLPLNDNIYSRQEKRIKVQR